MENQEDKVREIIFENINYKFDKLKEEYEALIEIMPQSVAIDWSIRQVICTYFEPDTEQEKEEIIKAIARFANILKMNFHETIFSVYVEMESLLDKKINKKISQQKDQSHFKAKLDYLIKTSKYELNNEEQILVDFINNFLRKSRNHIAHNGFESFSNSDVVAFIDDGENINSKLFALLDDHIKEANNLYDVFDWFLQLYKKL